MLQRERRRTPNTPCPRQERHRRPDVDDVHKRADQRCDVERGDAVAEDAQALEEGAVGTLLVSVGRVVVDPAWRGDGQRHTFVHPKAVKGTTTFQRLKMHGLKYWQTNLSLYSDN
jgi:predicted GNAT family N-acyltransferase